MSARTEARQFQSPISGGYAKFKAKTIIGTAAVLLRASSIPPSFHVDNDCLAVNNGPEDALVRQPRRRRSGNNYRSDNRGMLPELQIAYGGSGPKSAAHETKDQKIHTLQPPSAKEIWLGGYGNQIGNEYKPSTNKPTTTVIHRCNEPVSWPIVGGVVALGAVGFSGWACYFYFDRIKKAWKEFRVCCTPTGLKEYFTERSAKDVVKGMFNSVKNAGCAVLGCVWDVMVNH